MIRGSVHILVRSSLHRRLAAYPLWRRYSHDSLKHIVASSRVIRFGQGIIKYTLFTSLGIVAATAVGFEGTHLWIEKVELSPEQDSDVKRWEWDEDVEKWSGDSVMGGTDPSLGHHGRHWVRAAWAAYNWGETKAAAVIAPDSKLAHSESQPEDLKLIDTNMKTAEAFLRGALRIANERNRDQHLHPETISQLIYRHASILERLGEEAVQESRSEYERAWVGFAGEGLDAANIAARLGEISFHLNQRSDAILWWSRSIKLTRGEVPDDLKKLSSALGTLPSSPRAQRILATTLVSLSAFYAQTGQFDQAQAIEEATLAILRNVSLPAPSISVSPPHALHALYLLHRSSLISIHLAEVLNARGKPPALSIQHLTSAAESSERVARALTGKYHSSWEKSIPLQDTTPSSAYMDSRSMKKPALALLRDARRTTAEAWNLIGILNETQGKNISAALQCYERAVHWAATTDPTSHNMKPHEDILESEWTSIWNNYNRAKESAEDG
ncbi:hypothetical protein C0993_010016 [Termitomyces sp. T159_Od127]|nr:hypothetical protein C0993_010016 [Termitomyces sp. T159_Od127]